jgi:hypothetical protein
MKTTMKTTLKTFALFLSLFSIWGGVLAQDLEIFEKDGKFGYKDIDGNIIIEAKYDDAWGFSEGLSVVSIGCEWGINAEMENECTNGKWGFINKEGKEIIPIIYGESYPFKEGFAVVFVGENKGYGMSGTSSQIDSMKNEKRKVNGYTLINTMGQPITKIYYDNAYSFREGLAKVEFEGKFGYINYNGEEIIQLKYDEASHFQEGKAKVTLNGRTFYIDINGNEIK